MTNVDVNVSVSIDLEELVDEISRQERRELVSILKEKGVDVTDLEDGGPTAENAYYAFANGDMETARLFLCAAAGRIA